MLLIVLWAWALGCAAKAAWPDIALRELFGALLLLSALHALRAIAAALRSPLDTVERPLNAMRHTRWRNLGLWPPADETTGHGDYAAACAAMAQRVGALANVGAGAGRVLDVGCGAGESLRVWAECGATHIVGADALPPAECVAPVERCDAAAVNELTALGGGSFDAVVCVDAAYHFAPSRAAFFGAAHEVLVPGGRLALADVLAKTRASTEATWQCRAARAAVSVLMRVPRANLCDAAAYKAQLASSGFDDVTFEHVTDRVVGGFARFASQHAQCFDSPPDRPGWAWSSVARAGAALAAAFEYAELEYVFVSATKAHVGHRGRGSAPVRRRSQSPSRASASNPCAGGEVVGLQNDRTRRAAL